MSPDDFSVFPKYKDAPSNAFGSKNNPESFVSDEDKQRYTNIHQTLLEVVHTAKDSSPYGERMKLKKMSYSPEYGARGHRPVDMWMSLCGAESDEFGKMPQIYVIASDRGLEVGFAVSIDESDYHDVDTKIRNRDIVPRINEKLPNSASPLAASVQQKLTQSDTWHLNKKARLTPVDEGWEAWGSFADMIDGLKKSGSAHGGGSIVRVADVSNVSTKLVSEMFDEAMEIFTPVLLACQPSSEDAAVLHTSAVVEQLTKADEFRPENLQQAKETVLRSVAARRGQKKFRDKLLKAYDYHCAVSRTAVPSVLEAAHIVPYNGDETNHVSNGLLLRADIHTLFDLGLLSVRPDTCKVEISSSLMNTPYKAYNNIRILMPKSERDRPSQEALALRRKLYS